MKRISLWKSLLAFMIVTPMLASAADWQSEPIVGPFDGFSTTLVSYGGSNLAAFVRRSNDSIWYRLKTNGTWGPWIDMQVCSFMAPQVASWGPNHIAVVVLGCSTTTLKYKMFDGTSWSPTWTSISGKYNTYPSIVSLGVGQLTMAVVGTNDNVYTLDFNNGAWGTPLDHNINSSGSAKIIVTGPNQVAVFMADMQDIAQIRYRVRTAGNWNSWANIGGDLVVLRPGLCEVSGKGGGFAPTSWGNGHMAVFASKSGTLQLRQYINGSWTSWALVPGVREVPTILRAPPKSAKVGQLDVFYSDTREFCDKTEEDFRLLHSRLEGAEWTTGVLQSGRPRLRGISNPIAIGPGRMSVFAGTDASTNLTHYFENAPQTQPWLPALLQILFE